MAAPGCIWGIADGDCLGICGCIGCGAGIGGAGIGDGAAVW